MPVCLVALSGQAPQPRSGAPKAQGLRARRGPNDNLARRDDAQKLGVAHYPLSDPVDLPEVTAFSSRFDAVIGAG
jgi:hypothetical protein